MTDTEAPKTLVVTWTIQSTETFKAIIDLDQLSPEVQTLLTTEHPQYGGDLLAILNASGDECVEVNVDFLPNLEASGLSISHSVLERDIETLEWLDNSKPVS